jgi:glyoxylase-like metal-dependent hydrolase (beta-lactamase superfamily II)
MPSPYTFSVGGFTCSVVSDGVGELTTESLLERMDGSPGLMRDALARLHPEGTFAASMNALLVQTPGGVVLVDTGNGPRGEPASGEVARRVAELLPPEQVDVVVLTHGHGDHIGGLLDNKNEPTYPAARYVMNTLEWDGLMGPGGRFAAEPDESYFRSRLLAIKPRLTLVDGEAEVLPGVRVQPVSGHTVGHMTVLVESRGERLLHLVDAIHYPVQLVDPSWSPNFDGLKELSVPNRQALLATAAAEGLLVLAYHFAFPGLGYVRREGAAFAWEAAEP